MQKNMILEKKIFKTLNLKFVLHVEFIFGEKKFKEIKTV